MKPDGLILSVRLTPKSSRDALDGVDVLSDGKAIVKVKVRALADQGKANAALLQVISQALKVPVSKVTLVSGSTSRMKIIRVEGDGAVLAASLAKVLQLALDEANKPRSKTKTL
ncbi:MAG: hypothetical protein EBY21_04975 [Alphaproteobacteria bacterium]|nr:hypothetical protein [Alphaproteobacteria bacterium]